MNIFKQLKTDVINVGTQLGYGEGDLNIASIEIPKDNLNGDLSTNIAMILAAKLGKNPREIALKFYEGLSNLPYVAAVEVAGPGFINFTIKADKWHQCIKSILLQSNDYKVLDIGKGKKVNVEYVSANPTGPMHIGHARGAVYGDALAGLLKVAGFDVTKEFYVNDAGSQIDTLIASVFLRYKEAVTGEAIEIPKGYYPGEYLIAVGQKLKSNYGDKLMHGLEPDVQKILKEVTIEEMLNLIKRDLNDLGVEHDLFFSEQTLHDRGKIEAALEKLKSLDMVYRGVVPAPKGKVPEDWEEKEQLLFKSTVFGDEQDRPVQKSDGSWTYLAADLAYAQDKIDRGFDHLLFVLGADHSGYVKRIEATVKVLGQEKVGVDVKICQLVNFMENGVPVKMSKRSGTFTTVRDVLEEVDPDIIRFIMLTRKNDVTLDFDLEKVKEQSKDNPVFYVQYAHVRILSILANCAENCKEAYDKFTSGDYNLSLLSSEEEIELIKLLSSWPKVIESAARSFEPHRVAFYLINIASKFHALWNLGKENNDYRFVTPNNIELTASRQALVASIKEIMCRAFEVIGVEPLSKM